MAGAAAAAAGTTIQWDTVKWEDFRDAALSAFKSSAFKHHHTHNSWLVLEAVLRLAWVHAQRSPGHACYSMPSEAWLGDWCHIARETVSDSIRRLEAHGLLLVTRRRPVGRKFVTNLYRISGRVAAHLIRVVARALPGRRAPNPLPRQRRLCVTPLSHAENPVTTSTIFKRWLTRGQAKGDPNNG